MTSQLKTLNSVISQGQTLLVVPGLGEKCGKMQRADWVVVMTEPMREFYAASNIRRANHKCYIPVVFDPKLLRRFPLFRGYIFAHCPNRAVGDLMFTRGVARVIMAANKPLMVANDFIKRLQARENKNGVIHLDNRPTSKYPVFKSGDCVRLNNGPFAQIDAIFDCSTAHDRVRLLLKWLGQTVPVTVPIEQVEAA